MNNVDKAMELAEAYAAYRISAIKHGNRYGDIDGSENNWKALHAHLEAMEADRVRLLEALEYLLDNEGDYSADGVALCRSAIEKSRQ